MTALMNFFKDTKNVVLLAGSPYGFLHPARTEEIAASSVVL